MLGNLGLRPKEAINYVILNAPLQPSGLAYSKKKKKKSGLTASSLRQRNVLERILEQESKV